MTTGVAEKLFFSKARTHVKTKTTTPPRTTIWYVSINDGTIAVLKRHDQSTQHGNKENWETIETR